MSFRTHLKTTLPDRRVGLPRPHLVTSLSTGIMQNRVTLLQADAGYGKTTLLREFVEQADATVGWYRIDRTDRRLSQFVGYLADVVQTHVPTFTMPLGEIDDTAAGSPCEESCHYLALQFAHEFSRVVDTPFVIILDNYEQVGASSHVNLFLSSLIEFTPPYLHLVLSTREKPHLPWSRLRVDQELFEAGSADLAFAPTETSDLCSSLLEHPVDGAMVEIIQEKTGGWPAGIVMFLRSLHDWRCDEWLSESTELSGMTPIVRDYFEEEVFAKCPGDAQDFLMRTAILSSFDADVGSELVPESNASEILAVLENLGTFIRATDRGCGSYCYHDLFREFLLDRLQTHASADIVRDLYLRAAIALERKREIEEAHRCYMEAGAFDTVADLLERVADDYLERYMLDIVRNWMSAIPERIRAGRPWLLAFQGKTMRRLANPTVALSALDMAWKLFAERGDEFGMAYVAYEAGFTYSQIGQAKKGVETIQETLARIGPDHALRARLFVALCLNNLHLDDLVEAENYANLSLHELEQIPLHPARFMLESRARQYLAQVHARRGNLHAARDESDHSLALCDEENLGDFKRSWALHTQGYILALQGSWKAALAALASAEEYGDRDDRLRSRAINHVRGNIYRELGEFSLAHECYERCGDSALIEEAFLCLREGRVSEAESLTDAARRFHEMRDSDVDRAIVNVVEALIAETRCETDAMSRRLEDATKTFRERKTDHLLASAYLQLARCNFVRGCEQAAIDYLYLSFDIAARCDLRYFFWCDLTSFSSLIGHALKHNIHVHHVSKMLRIRLMDGYSSEFLPLFDYPDVAVQEHVARILDGAARDTHTSLCVAEGLLKTCRDAHLHLRILKYISGELLSMEMLMQLRSRHKLTWREIEVFAVYYQHVDDKLIPRESGRRRVAEQLFMSENTLKIHLGNIRRKIGSLPR